MFHVESIDTKHCPFKLHSIMLYHMIYILDIYLGIRII